MIAQNEQMKSNLISPEQNSSLSNESKRGYPSLSQYCIENEKKYLISEWHLVKNEGRIPNEYSAGSSIKVWWRCSKCGYEWRSSVYSRAILGQNCPTCANRVVVEEYNDIATTNPKLAEQWHPTLNGTLTPRQVNAGSQRKVWWICEKGHSWQARISSRTRGCGCPVCANRIIVPGVNDLRTTHPDLSKEWHPSKNGDLSPERISYGYDKKVWWRCRHGHEWQASPKSRIKETAGCPICSNYIAAPGVNDLATFFPSIAAEWHPTKNGTLTPDQVVPGSNRAVWWQCKLGHEWSANVVDRTRNTTGCPYCTNRKVLPGFNDLLTTHPDISKEWHPSLNGFFTPQMVTAGSKRRIWWICSEGHVWRTAICNRAGKNKQTGCPVCAGNVRVEYRQEYYNTLIQPEIRHAGK